MFSPGTTNAVDTHRSVSTPACCTSGTSVSVALGRKQNKTKKSKQTVSRVRLKSKAKSGAENVLRVPTPSLDACRVKDVAAAEDADSRLVLVALEADGAHVLVEDLRRVVQRRRRRRHHSPARSRVMAVRRARRRRRRRPRPPPQHHHRQRVDALLRRTRRPKQPQKQVDARVCRRVGRERLWRRREEDGQRGADGVDDVVEHLFVWWWCGYGR